MLETIFSLTTFWWVLLVLVYLPCCVALITIVLLQKGKGAGFAGAFGLSPGSESVFGPKLARTLPQKLTYISAGIFMVLAILLSTISGKVGKGTAPNLVTNEISTEQSKELDALFNNKTPNTTTPVTVDNNKANTPPIETTTTPPSNNQSSAGEKSPSETPTSNQ
ncbi:MAG TPA: preprotein translocase subunit SecG [Candidatus Hydrogenedens sp.]|nr:preprotein translocase subunit SecG [Candidatus Hydrogenedens sp.]